MKKEQEQTHIHTHVYRERLNCQLNHGLIILFLDYPSNKGGLMWLRTSIFETVSHTDLVSATTLLGLPCPAGNFIRPKFSSINLSWQKLHLHLLTAYSVWPLKVTSIQFSQPDHSSYIYFLRVRWCHQGRGQWIKIFKSFHDLFRHLRRTWMLLNNLFFIR